MKARPLSDRVLLMRIEEKEAVKGGIIISAALDDEAMTTNEKSSGMRQSRSAIACITPGIARSFMVTRAVKSGHSASISLNAVYPARGDE